MVSLSVLCSLNLTLPRKLEQLVHTDSKHSIFCTLQFLQEYKHEFLSLSANTQSCAFRVRVCHHTSWDLHKISKAEPVHNCSEKVQCVNARGYFTSFNSTGFVLLKLFSELPETSSQCFFVFFLMDHGVCRILPDLGFVQVGKMHFWWNPFLFLVCPFLQMYITSTIKTKSSRLAKPVLCLGTLCAAFLTGLNRVSEYRNHCSDVIAGFILGSAVALFLVSPAVLPCSF